MKSTDLLLEDHKHIIAAVNVLVEMARAASDQTLSETDVADVLRFLKEFADRHHQGKEEAVLFPALLHDRLQRNYHKLRGLIFEHERQRSIIDGLEESLLDKNRKDFVYYAIRLSETLRVHIREEEDTLFPLVDSTLSAAEEERVTLELKTYDTAWQEKELASQLRRLADLELKYLGDRRTDPQKSTNWQKTQFQSRQC